MLLVFKMAMTLGGLQHFRKGPNNCLEPSPREEMTDHTLSAQSAVGLRRAPPSDQAGEGRLRLEFLLTTQALAGFLLSLKTFRNKDGTHSTMAVWSREKQADVSWVSVMWQSS